MSLPCYLKRAVLRDVGPRDADSAVTNHRYADRHISLVRLFRPFSIQQFLDTFMELFTLDLIPPNRPSGHRPQAMHSQVSLPSLS